MEPVLSPASPLVVVPATRGVYVTGINKRVDRTALLSHFIECGTIAECEFSEHPRKGSAWLRFESQESANKAVRTLHHTELLGTVIVVRHEEVSKSGARIAVSKGSTSLPPKSIAVLESAYGKGSGAASLPPKSVAVTYAGKGLLVGNVEYPIPSGSYLMRLLLQCHSNVIKGRQPLIDALLDARHGNHHAKELSESMAMVNALSVASHRTGADLNHVEGVRVYVLGDGVTPFTAIVMLLFAPPSWRFISIDPLMNFDPAVLGPDYASRLTCVAALSQDYALTEDYPRDPSGPAGSAGFADDVISVPTLDCIAAGAVAGEKASGTMPYDSDPTSAPISRSRGRSLRIVVACHSHAPLQEFWGRVQRPKLAVSLPCCGKTWSLIQDVPPLHSYDDFEVFSPKRRIYLYEQGLSMMAPSTVG